MRSRLLRTTAVALIGFGLAGAPLALAQSMDPATAPAATPPTAPPEGGIESGAPRNDAIPNPSQPSGGTVPPASGDAAQAPAAPGADPSASPAAQASNMQPAGTVLSKDMTGATVQSTAGEDVATLSDLVVEPNGRVTGAILTIGGVLGVGGKEVIVPWEELTVGSDGSTITVAMSEQQLDQAPAFQPLPKEAESTSTAPSAGADTPQ